MRWLLLAAALAAGCGDGNTPVASGNTLGPGDLVGGGSSVEVSFCTPERDPFGLFCAEFPPPIDLKAADEAARREFPQLEDATLYTAVSSRNGQLNPDGQDLNWSLNYFLPELSRPPESELRFVSVGSYDQGISIEMDESNPVSECDLDHSIGPLDSRGVVHDSVTRFEEVISLVQLGDGNNLYFEQWASCIADDLGLPARNFVRFARPGGMNLFAYYDDDGEFVQLDGPCLSTSSSFRCD
jgi:hypothetical protein